MNINENEPKPIGENYNVPVLDGRYGDNPDGAVPGINTPGIELPAYNPPIPNRAWTAMREGVDIDSLTEEEKRDLYVGRDNIF